MKIMSTDTKVDLISVRYMGFKLRFVSPQQPKDAQLEPGLVPPFKAPPQPVGKQHAQKN